MELVSIVVLKEKIEDYRRGYFVNAINVEEFEHFGPVVLFRKSFEKACSDALAAIAQRRVQLGS